jgi:t-SNARE complex subunit (syntaxin)
MIVKLLVKLFEFIFNQSRDVDQSNWKWKLLYIVPLFLGCALTVFVGVVGDKAIETYDKTVERNLEMTKTALGTKDALNNALADQVGHLKGQIHDLSTRATTLNMELMTARRENELDGKAIQALESGKKLLEEELHRLRSEVAYCRELERKRRSSRN